ncbi:ABC transporter permease [Radicibacter daui]|uniref:ABC transporter permease n=1 Tax=Radicibacter daui TaxID=3064829 RepID=UPI004046BA0F
MFEKRSTGVLLTLPALVFLLVLFVLPVMVLLTRSLALPEGWGLGNFASFFSSELNRTIFWRTLRLAATVTAACVVLGYITAFGVLSYTKERRGMLTGFVILPLMISPVARTYAWIVVLGRTGFLNAVLTSLGIIDSPLRLLFTETAVFIGLVQLFLPLMVLPLLSALENLPRDVIPAAQLLGASRLMVLFKVILPLTREGLVVGGTLVFTGSVTAYITPAILGGSKVMMLETLLYQRINVANDLTGAAVIAVILVITTLAANKLLRRLATPRQRQEAR